MIIYNYNRITLEFIGESEATPNPLEEGEFLVPAYAIPLIPLDKKSGFEICFIGDKWEYVEVPTATKYDENFEVIKSYLSINLINGVFVALDGETLKPLPTLQANEVAIFNTELNEWEVKADFRGQDYWLKSDATKVEFIIGLAADATMTDKEPLNDFPLWEADKWVDEPVATLAKAKTLKLLQIKEDYKISEAAPIKVTHTIHGEITYHGGGESADKIDKYVRLKQMGGAVDGHMIWDINGDETALTDAEAKEVILAIGNKSSTDDFTKKNRKVAVVVATTVTDVNII